MNDTFFLQISELVKWVEQNPFIVTVTSSGAIIWLFANLKNVWNLAINGIKALISFEIVNTYEDARAIGPNSLRLRQIEFNRLLMSSKALWERTVNLDLSDYVNNNMSMLVLDPCIASNDIVVKSSIVNTYGFSIRIFLGKIATITRSYKLDGQRITMNSNIRVFFASKKKFMKKLSDMIDLNVKNTFEANSNSQYIEIFSGNSSLRSFSKKFKRNLDSIFTKNNIHKELFNDIKHFIDNKDIYKKLNYPYNYCALLYGIPGSGKTSTILAIASELKRNIHYINIANMTTQNLMQEFNDDPKNNIYVFEDIDAVSYKNTNNRKNNNDEKINENNESMSKLLGISLSDLLNLTDGLLASDGTICLFTTNCIEKLDPAFLRAGRMNKIVEFTNMNPDVANDMLETYLNVRLANIKDNIKPAELQEMILDVLLKKKTLDDVKKKFCDTMHN